MENLDARILVLRAESLFYLEEYNEAAPFFAYIEQKYLRFDETLPGREMKELKYRCFLKLGQISLWKEELTEAEGHLLRAKEEKSTDYRVFKYLGELHSRQGDFERAADFFESSLEIMNDGEVKEELMVCKYLLTDFSGCMLYAQELVEMSQMAEEDEEIRNERAEKFLIMSLIQQQLIDEALRYTNNFYVGMESSPDYNALKGYIFKILGRDEESIRYKEMTENILEEIGFEEEQVELYYDVLKNEISDKGEDEWDKVSKEDQENVIIVDRPEFKTEVGEDISDISK